MKIVATASSLLILAASTLAATVNVTFDQTYDNAGASLNTVACSNGENGLITKGFTTFGSLPSFPNIGGAPGATWNSKVCGTCWALTFQGRTVNVLAIDAAGAGFNIAKTAFSTLTNGNTAPGKVEANVHQVDSSVCGL